MIKQPVDILLTINGETKQLSVGGQESLLDALRRVGYKSVKHGCKVGDCGVCTILLDGEPVRSCMMRATAAADHDITTVEGLSQGSELHPVQKAFVDSGAIQCGYCTPAQVLTAKALLDRNPTPSQAEIREAMGGVLCRCTGYVRIIDAAQRASALLQGDPVTPVNFIEKPLPKDPQQFEMPDEFYRRDGNDKPLPPLLLTPIEMPKTRIVGKAQVKVDAEKLVRGRPVFTDDLQLDSMLYAALLTSPHAHARIKHIDASQAREMPGVHAVLTYEDLPRVKYSSAGLSYPNVRPFDQVCLDNKVRHKGDRVAVVAAETPKLAKEALRGIKVEYEKLPAVVDPEEAMVDGAPVIHDESDTEGIHDPQHNIVHHIDAQVGDVEAALADAQHVLEGEYRTQKQQHVHLEPHVCISYWDEDQRMVIRTATQVPFHIRRMLSPLIGLPVKRIRVTKPRTGGSFGNKQELVLEDLCAHLTIATGRPVKMEYTRLQEFTSSRSRHPVIMRYRAGVTNGKVTAIDLYTIGDTGAYGTHGLTVQIDGGLKSLTLYNTPNGRFVSDVVYTNTPPSGAFRGYGATQCQFGIEVLMEEIAEQLGVDVAEFKRANWLKTGEPIYIAKQLGEAPKGLEQVVEINSLEQCVAAGLEATDFFAKRQAHRQQDNGPVRRGIGMSIAMHGSGIAGLDMGAAFLKMNDDGSFNLMIGATDLGTGSDTILAQMAAEVLDIPVEDFIVSSSDTDITPFDTGAYASSTTYISGGAVQKAALKIKGQILEHAALMLGVEDSTQLILKDRQVVGPDGQVVSLADLALNSLHQKNQHQIMASASHMSHTSPPPVAAQFAEALVDTETGQVRVERLLMVVDCGRVINPTTAAGQVEGGMVQALGYATSEDMIFNAEGHLLNGRLAAYHVYTAKETPTIDVIFVQTNEPSGPFGAKSVAEISMDGVAPALASAIHDATGIWIRELPFTPERVWQALRKPNTDML